MKVIQLATGNVETCGPDDNLAVAAGKMWDRDIGCLPVVDSNQQVIGFITDRDICMAAYTQGKSLPEIPVSLAMSQKVLSCRPNDSISDAEETMRSSQIRRLPVVDTEGRLQAIISLNDIVREADREASLKERDISAQEVTQTLAAICQPRESRVPLQVV